MNINSRLRRFHQRQAARRAVQVPPWGELIRLADDQAAELAARLGIEPGERMATLSEIHRARG